METPGSPAAPGIRWRDAQPYVAIRRVVTMRTIPEIADRLPEVFGWLAHGASNRPVRRSCATA
jgi:hypothetical protein